MREQEHRAKALVEDQRILIGTLIRAARMDAGMSQETLADAVGLTRVSICNLEGGRQGLSVDVLLRLSDALSVEPADLLPDGDTYTPATVRLRGMVVAQRAELASLRSTVANVRRAVGRRRNNDE